MSEKPERKKVDLFTLLAKGLAAMARPNQGRVFKRKHGLRCHPPIWGPTFRYRITRTCTGVDQTCRSSKETHRARRIARVAA